MASLPATPPLAWKSATLHPRLTAPELVLTTLATRVRGLGTVAPLALMAEIVEAGSLPAAGMAILSNSSLAGALAAPTENARVAAAGAPVVEHGSPLLPAE